MILPNDNLAVTALLNTDGPWQDFVPLAVIDAVLGLNVSFPSPSLPSDSGSGSDTPISSCAPSVPIANFAGTYVNPGYGNITFCAPGENSTAYCAGALADWAAISANGSVDPHALYATTPRCMRPPRASPLTP